ncbi:hypothetical protein [Prauserella alba]|uniref:Uncharacterized protein n=1 Tax=Prauserella alba TaxID=176898 RepID=A0ABP4FW11_9PSEU|nr:hypothetical protein [Prauserella alba]MCP2179286.1 hypothetical protein [Prauserella alba]
MRLVRFSTRPAQISPDIRAALTSLGRSGDRVGGVGLVGVQPPEADTPVDAVIVTAHGVVVVVGVDLPDPAIRLEAPLRGAWKADDWPLTRGDAESGSDAGNPSSEALAVSEQVAERVRAAAGSPGTAIGTVIAVGPFVEHVEQPADELAGPVRIVYPSSTSLLASIVSLSSASRPLTVEQARAVVAALSPDTELDDDALAGEGFATAPSAVPVPADSPATRDSPADATDPLTDDADTEALDGTPHSGSPGPTTPTSNRAAAGADTPDASTGGSAPPSGAAPLPTAPNTAAPTSAVPASAAPTSAVPKTATPRPAGEAARTEPPGGATAGTATTPATMSPARPAAFVQSPAPPAGPQQTTGADAAVTPGVQTGALTAGSAPAAPPPAAHPSPGMPAKPSAATQPMATRPGTAPSGTPSSPVPSSPVPSGAHHPPRAAPPTSVPAGGAPLRRGTPRQAWWRRSSVRTWRWITAGAVFVVALVVIITFTVLGGDSEEAGPVRMEAGGLEFTQRAAQLTEECADHAVGDLSVALADGGCTELRRGSFGTTVRGTDVAVSVAALTFTDEQAAQRFLEVADTPGTGTIRDLATTSGRWAPPAPDWSGAAYVSDLEGSTVRLVLASPRDRASQDSPEVADAAEAALGLVKLND